MYIAMNRFKVIKGEETAFEQVWLSRDTHLQRVPGFIEFHLLRGPEHDDHTLYSSHSVWANQAAFTAWTQSEAFRAAHNPKRFVPRIAAPATTNRFISVIRNSRASKCCRRWKADRAAPGRRRSSALLTKMCSFLARGS
jgi:heme-degrading monooxygenase HmoA